MNIGTVISDMLYERIGDESFDDVQFQKGLDSFIESNGFCELEGRFDDEVVAEVIKNALSFVSDMNPSSIVLFFSNYSLIEEFRLLNNKTLLLAKEIKAGNKTLSYDLNELVSEFNRLSGEICSKNGLYEFMREQISETTLNINFAKERTPAFSKRLFESAE